MHGALILGPMLMDMKARRTISLLMVQKQRLSLTFLGLIHGMEKDFGLTLMTIAL